MYKLGADTSASSPAGASAVSCGRRPVQDRLIHRRAPWESKESVELATLEWVSWFNHHRLMEPIGYLPPAEVEANYHRQLAGQALSV